MAISPLEQENLAASVRMVYVQLEQQILADIAARLAKGIDKDNWRYKKLEEIRFQREEIEKALNDLGGKLPDYIRDVVLKSYNAGIKSADEDLGKYSSHTSATKLAEGFGRVHTRAVDAMVAERLRLMENVHLQILRSADDAYRSVIAQVAQGTLTGTETRRQSTQRALNHLADKGITGFTDSAGRNWNIGSYAEMATRTAVGNAAITGHLNRMTEHGRDLVIVSEHKEECARCRPWEGRVLSVSGSDPKYPGVQEARNAGLFHPNCGHTMHAYLEGFTKIPKGTADPQGDKERQQQRYLERQIRHWKKREAVAITDKDKAHAQRKVKDWQKATRDFVAKHDRLRQNHREQLRVGKTGVEKHFKDLPWLAKPKPKPPGPTKPTPPVAPKPKPKPPAPPKVETLKDKVDKLKAKGVNSEADAKAIGSLVRQEISTRGGDVLKAKAKLQTEYDLAVAAYKNLDDKIWALRQKAFSLDWNSQEYKAAQDELSQLAAKRGKIEATRNEKREALDKLKGLKGQTAKEVLSEIRPLGSSRPATWAKGSKTVTKGALENARQYLPTDWLNISDQTPMIGKHVSRGYYRQAWRGDPAEFALSGKTDKALLRVALHEMGHRFENVVPGVMKLESEFYKRRTAGESLAWLGGGYAKTEKTRFDKFLSPYMGKDYGNTDTSYYEILSMGIESVFVESYDLDKDTDFYDFILGVLAGL